MAASAVAIARALMRRLAHNAVAATSSPPPMTASTVAAARVLVHGLARDATAATSQPPVTASAVAAARIVVSALADNATASPLPSYSSPWSKVTVRITSIGLADDATAATFSPLPPSSSSLWKKKVPTGVPHHNAMAPQTTVRLFSSSAMEIPTPNPPNHLYPRNLLYLVNILNGMTLSNEEVLMFRKAFNEKFSHFKAADVVSFLEQEEVSFEECVFLLKILYSKLGENKGLAELLVQEDLTLSSTNDEIMKNPILARVEAKVDILRRETIQGHAELLKNVKAANKTEWGSVDILGRTFDITKLEYLKRLIEYVMGQ